MTTWCCSVTSLTPLRELTEKNFTSSRVGCTKAMQRQPRGTCPELVRTAGFTGRYMVADTVDFCPLPKRDLQPGSPGGSQPCSTQHSVTTLGFFFFFKEQLGSNLRTESGLLRVLTLENPIHLLLKKIGRILL